MFCLHVVGLCTMPWIAHGATGVIMIPFGVSHSYMRMHGDNEFVKDSIKSGGVATHTADLWRRSLWGYSVLDKK